MMESIHYREASYGFEWGACSIERVASGKWGVALSVKTPRQTLDIRVTPSGLIRLGKPTAPRGQEREP